jgi:hypothetical protein
VSESLTRAVVVAHLPLFVRHTLATTPCREGAVTHKGKNDPLYAQSLSAMREPPARRPPHLRVIVAAREQVLPRLRVARRRQREAPHGRGRGHIRKVFAEGGVGEDEVEDVLCAMARLGVLREGGQIERTHGVLCGTPAVSGIEAQLRSMLTASVQSSPPLNAPVAGVY